MGWALSVRGPYYDKLPFSLREPCMSVSVGIFSEAIQMFLLGRRPTEERLTPAISASLFTQPSPVPSSQSSIRSLQGDGTSKG